MTRIDARVHTGGCQCGAVRFRAEAPFGTAEFCHCRMCQKAFGNAGAALVAVPFAALQWTRGAPATFRSSAIVDRGFCAACGTPLYMREDGDTNIELAVGAFDEPARIGPFVQQIGVESRLPWFAGLAGLPEGRTEQYRSPAELAQLRSHQHPDHDTDVWLPQVDTLRRLKGAALKALRVLADDRVLAPFTAAIDSLDPTAAAPSALLPAAHPALVHLDRALTRSRAAPALLAAVRDVIPGLTWGGYPATGQRAALAGTMTWAEIAGSNGIIRRHDMRLGLFLLAPGTSYPLHSHGDLELYVVLSGSMSVEHGLDGKRQETAAPGYSITPPNMPHALHSGPEPVLILYCHTGDLTQPVRWLLQNADGTWR